MPDVPNPEYQRMFQRVAAQGEAFAEPILVEANEKSRFYGLLAKADEVEAGVWDVFFEVVNTRYLENVLGGRKVSVQGPLPHLPGLAYHLPSVSETSLLEALDLDKASEIAEGSWYELELTPGESGASGELYDPETEES